MLIIEIALGIVLGFIALAFLGEIVGAFLRIGIFVIALVVIGLGAAWLINSPESFFGVTGVIAAIVGIAVIGDIIKRFLMQKSYLDDAEVGKVFQTSFLSLWFLAIGIIVVSTTQDEKTILVVCSVVIAALIAMAIKVRHIFHIAWSRHEQAVQAQQGVQADRP